MPVSQKGRDLVVLLDDPGLMKNAHYVCSNLVKNFLLGAKLEKNLKASQGEFELFQIQCESLRVAYNSRQEQQVPR